MYEQKAAKRLKDLAKKFPVLAVTGLVKRVKRLW